MKFRTTAILLAVFAVLVGYVYFVELRKKPATSTVDKSTWVLTAGEEDVQELQMTDAGASLHLVRGDDQTWYIDRLGGELADQARTGLAVNSLVSMVASRVLTDTSALADYGLASPPMVVTVTLPEGKQEVVNIGAKNPQGNAYYVQRKGQPKIYLIYTSVVDDVKNLVANPYPPTPTPAPAAAPGAQTPPPAPTAAP